jgi:hypothetical protein
VHFSLHGQPQGHHDRVRFSWRLCVGGRMLSGDQRLQSVTGFLDAAPATA